MGGEVKSSLGAETAPTEFSLGVEASCDTLSVELDVDVAALVGVSLGGEFKTDGTVTLYLGPKLAVGHSLGPFSAEGSVKSGAYITMDKDAFRDVGVKTVTKTTTKVGALGAAATSSQTVGEGKMSFVPGPERGSYGLSMFVAPPR